MNILPMFILDYLGQFVWPELLVSCNNLLVGRLWRPKLRKGKGGKLNWRKIPSVLGNRPGYLQEPCFRYSVMAGTPEKMLEHLLESRLDNRNETEIGVCLYNMIILYFRLKSLLEVLRKKPLNEQ